MLQAVAKGTANGDEMIERWKKYLLRNRYVAVASAIIIALATLLSGITGTPATTTMVFVSPRILINPFLFGLQNLVP